MDKDQKDQKDQNERIKKYVDALEKTNKHLIIALQKMLEWRK